MLTTAEVEVLHRAHAAFVRRFLQRYRRKVQDADREDIEQKVWLNVLSRATREQLRNAEAFLTTVTRNAVSDFFEHRGAPKRDVKKTASIDDTNAVKLPDTRTASADASVDAKRTRCRVRALREAMNGDERATFDSVMARDFDRAPKKEQKKVVAIVKCMMALPARPLSVEHPDPLDGTEHCGETVRRLRLVVDERDEISALEDPYLDAAE